MAQLKDGKEYRGEGKWVRLQAILDGGTATLSCRTANAPAASEVETMSEGFVDVHTPLLGFYSVVLTGSAKVYS